MVYNTFMPSDIKKTIKLSQSLFSPKLDLVWKFRGDTVALIFEGELIWDNHDLNPESWRTNTNASVNLILKAYLSTPVSTLSLRKISLPYIPDANAYYSRKYWKERWVKSISKHPEMQSLLGILYAADRRIGKNKQSIWLFTTDCNTSRRISHRRL